MSQSALNKPAQIAVYDFDGTCIAGNSPVLLVGHLIRHRMLRPSVSLRIGFWALAYKLRLPQNESWVRSLVFSAFEGWPKEKVDSYLMEFYDDVIASRWRDKADESIRKHVDAGHVVMVVSATFDPIVVRAQDDHPFQYSICTKMKVDSHGCYTREVDGLPVEGEEKPASVRLFADEHFGAGQWNLSWAYGDHHSDRYLLEAADEAFAVTPDKPLARIADKRGWNILEW